MASAMPHVRRRSSDCTVRRWLGMGLASGTAPDGRTIVSAGALDAFLADLGGRKEEDDDEEGEEEDEEEKDQDEDEDGAK